MFLGLVSITKPISIDEALQDSELILAIQEELNQFSINDVWTRVPGLKENMSLEPSGFSETR